MRTNTIETAIFVSKHLTMKVLVDIPDNKLPFGLEVLRSLSFVKGVKPISTAKAQLWEELQEAASEVSEHKKGTKKLKSAQELLNEL